MGSSRELIGDSPRLGIERPPIGYGVARMSFHGWSGTESVPASAPS